MASMEQRLSKLREERIAREKARIEKLRQLNLQKYGKNESTSGRNQHKEPVAKPPRLNPSNLPKKPNSLVKNNFHVNSAFKRPASAPAAAVTPASKDLYTVTKRSTGAVARTNHDCQASTSRTQIKPSTSKTNVTKPNCSKKSVETARVKQSVGEGSTKRMSVFERLYKPKVVPKPEVGDAQKLKSDPNYLKEVLGNAEMITGKRRTISHPKPEAALGRRSISAVHLRRANKSELSKCIHNWSSVGDKLNKVNINEVEEDDCVDYEKVVSAVKSERKKVKFLTPISMKYNTPRPEELQERLKSWLEKRGKSLHSFHHLQCFGLFHMSKNLIPAPPAKPQLYDEENKENIALESDSDDQSYTENLNDRKGDFDKETREQNGNYKWRRASYVSDNTSLNDSKNTTLTHCDDYSHVDDLLLGALNDLTELLREGFDWGQCARWLRAIRQRYPGAPRSAAYWECRAALEERRGDLPASMQCWEEAIAMGTERSVVEANLDHLLDKFMQLKISPSSGRQKQADPKLVDVKNVLKSTIIRFAVHKAKFPKSSTPDTKPQRDTYASPPSSRFSSRRPGRQAAGAYAVTPVRRSARLSARAPLTVCATLGQASRLGHPLVFVPNDRLFGTP